MRISSFSLLACLAAALTCWLAPAASAAEPEVVASAEGTCTTDQYGFGSASVTTSPVSRAVDGAMLRLTGLSGPGTGSYSGDAIAEGDVLWRDMSNLTAGETRTYTIGCSQPSTSFGFRVELLAAGTPPQTFVGASSSRYNALVFTAPWAAQYQAQVGLASGSVTLAGDAGFFAPSQTFASPGTYALGKLTAGTRKLTVNTRSGPRAAWSVTVTPLPLVVSGVRVGRASSFDQEPATVVKPGDVLEVGFDTTAQATLAVDVVAPSGTRARALAAGYAAAPGAQELTWDGRDAAGNALADGTYRVRVSGTDPGGSSSAGEATVTLDGTAPKVASSTAGLTTVAPRQAVILTATDGAGVAKLSATYSDETTSTEYAARKDQLTVLPSGGWAPGSTVALTVTTADLLGNERASQVVFKVSGGVVPSLVTLTGVAGVTPGMTQLQVEDAWGVKLKLSYPHSRACGTASVAKGPVRGYVIFESGKFAAAFFHKGVQTDKGIKIGSTAAAVKRAYRGRFKAVRAPYSGGVDYYVRPSRTRWLRVETSKRGRVTSIDFGNRAAGYMEGCV